MSEPIEYILVSIFVTIAHHLNVVNPKVKSVLFPSGTIFRDVLAVIVTWFPQDFLCPTFCGVQLCALGRLTVLASHYVGYYQVYIIILVILIITMDGSNTEAT